MADIINLGNNSCDDTIHNNFKKFKLKKMKKLILFSVISILISSSCWAQKENSMVKKDARKEKREERRVWETIGEWNIIIKIY